MTRDDSYDKVPAEEKQRRKDEYNEYLRKKGHTRPERVTSSNGRNRYIEAEEKREKRERYG